jgi:hypothetical protein
MFEPKLFLGSNRYISYDAEEIVNRAEIEGMWGFGIYLMHLADYFAGRKRKKKAKTCDVCGQQFRTREDMEAHRRKEHPNAQPREEEAT